MTNKIILIIHYDPSFPQIILSLFENKQEITFLLADNLAEAAKTLKSDDFGCVIMEYPVSLSTEVVLSFLSQPFIEKLPVLMIAKEKQFLDSFNMSNIRKFSQDEVTSKVVTLVDDLLK